MLVHAFLCLRRGVSLEVAVRLSDDVFSLPTQRCFRLRGAGLLHGALFSAYAEVFPESHATQTPWLTFLCLRRGVSLRAGDSYLHPVFSLPTQRCFRRKRLSSYAHGLFSAYAEVFPWLKLLTIPSRPFLCLRRGVSQPQSSSRFYKRFSLPTQRCFDTSTSRIIGW